MSYLKSRFSIVKGTRTKYLKSLSWKTYCLYFYLLDRPAFVCYITCWLVTMQTILEYACLGSAYSLLPLDKCDTQSEWTCVPRPSQCILMHIEATRAVSSSCKKISARKFLNIWYGFLYRSILNQRLMYDTHFN